MWPQRSSSCTRHYFCRHPSLAERAGHIIALHRLIVKLEAFFQLRLLPMVGTSHKRIIHLPASNRRLGLRLSLIQVDLELM